MKEEWREIRGFPRYGVSNLGRVRHEPRERILSLYQNQYNVVIVGLMRGRKQCKRSVPLLVAKEFIPKPREVFDTPINLNGDRWDNRVENLMWRPRAFAIRYNWQFINPYPHHITVPIRDKESGLVYSNSFVAAITFGLLEMDLVLSIVNNTCTWPTYQFFEVI